MQHTGSIIILNELIVFKYIVESLNSLILCKSMSQIGILQELRIVLLLFLIDQSDNVFKELNSSVILTTYYIMFWLMNKKIIFNSRGLAFIQATSYKQRTST